MNSNIKLIQTCGACPEQYVIVDIDGNKKGYINLRYGVLTVVYNRKPVYNCQFPDEWKGCFNNPDELAHYLNKIENIIKGIDRHNYYEE